RFFRKKFILTEGEAIESARLRISADDKFTVRLNGDQLGGAADWHSGKQFNDIARRLRPGANVIAIAAENLPAKVPANPAGLIACLELKHAGGKSLKIVSDGTWLCSRIETVAWVKAG